MLRNLSFGGIWNNIFFTNSQIHFIYPVAPIDITNDSWSTYYAGYIYKLHVKIHFKDNTWTVIIFTIIQDSFAKFGRERGLRLSRKHCIVR